jgi:hypothetical protein
MPGWRVSRIVALSNTPASSGAGSTPPPITNAGGAGQGGGFSDATCESLNFRLESMTGCGMPE